MAVKSASRRLSINSFEDRKNEWAAVHQFLEVGQYEPAIEILRILKEETARTNQADLESIITAAYQICLACVLSREEMEWHRKAYQKADLREGELLQHLYTILRLIEGYDASQPGFTEQQVTSSLRDTASLWERLQTLLGFEPQIGNQDGRSSGVPAEVGDSITNETEVRLKVISGKKDGTSPPLSVDANEGTALVADQIMMPFIDGVETKTTDRNHPVFQGKSASSSPIGKVIQTRQGYPFLAVNFLGAFQVFQNEKLISNWDSLKAKSIFKYLLLHHKTPIIKDVLMDVFWPDAPPEAARRNLHQAIYTLRQKLRRDQPDFQFIRFENDRYFLNPEMDIFLDFYQFEDLVEAGRQLETAGQIAEAMEQYGNAEGLYQGDFLEEDVYEDWPNSQREQLKNMYLEITDRMSDYYLQQRELMIAIALCRKIIAKDNCHENAHCRLMKCYLAQGQRHLAIHQYQICVQALKNELDMVPSSETRALYKQISNT